MSKCKFKNDHLKHWMAGCSITSKEKVSCLIDEWGKENQNTSKTEMGENVHVFGKDYIYNHFALFSCVFGNGAL